MPVRAALVLLLLAPLAACTPQTTRIHGNDDGARARVAILETTDLHSHLLSYDYDRLKADPGAGFDRVATLIEKARSEFANNVLIDDGDTLQGTALADYQALKSTPPCDREVAMYRAMDALHYDAGTAGNHEFNYGLTYLSRATGVTMNVAGVPAEHCAGPHYPIVLSNVYSARDGRPIFRPWVVIHKTIDARTADGRSVKLPLKIGVLGFTPPPIMVWDRKHLKGKVTVSGMVEAAKRYLPELRAQGVDLVMAVAHTGIDTRPYTHDMENAGWYLAGVPGIDVLLLGHSHAVFPDPGNADSRFKGLKAVDNQRGFVRGTPAVMGGFHGMDLGVIELALVRRDGHWRIDKAATHSEVRPVCRNRDDCVAPDPAIAPLVAQAHQATIAYVNTPIGRSDFRMSTYFADLGDVSALAVVNAAQIAYVRDWITHQRPDLADVPLLSAAAAFKTGFAGADDYTDVPPGPLSIRNAGDLYLYPNTLAAVKIDGALLKGWLEHAARRFNRIDPHGSQPQPLINTHYPGYNFDQIQGGLSYVIDVSQPVAQRIEHLRYHGKPVQPSQTFVVVTNNYRANGGGHFPGLDGDNTILAAPDSNRQVVIDWVRRHRHLTRKDVDMDAPWHFAPLHAAGPVTCVTATGKADVANLRGVGVRPLRRRDDGKSVYAVEIGRPLGR